MKVILISGSCTNTGKTTAGQTIAGLFPNAALIKIGDGAYNADKPIPLYPMGTSLETIQNDFPDADVLIIESGTLAESIQPELSIFMPGDTFKPGSQARMDQADLIAGSSISCRNARGLAARSGIEPKVLRAIMDSIQIKLCECEFGVFS